MKAITNIIHWLFEFQGAEIIEPNYYRQDNDTRPQVVSVYNLLT